MRNKQNLKDRKSKECNLFRKKLNINLESEKKRVERDRKPYENRWDFLEIKDTAQKEDV